MLTNFTQSRAAILCFGGWGLQVLFHLLPRLQAIQEQRVALQQSVQAHHPEMSPYPATAYSSSTYPVGDLENTIRFGAVFPDAHVTPLNTISKRNRHGESYDHPEQLLHDQYPDQSQFTLYRPELNKEIPPFFVERVLAGIDQSGYASEQVQQQKTTASLTASERRAAQMLQATMPHLHMLQYGNTGFHTDALSRRDQAMPIERATRHDLFHTGLVHAEQATRLLETHVVDPIRHDVLSPDDVFVQTTLYVLFPCFEPAASSLVWPLVAQMMKRVGRRHINQVVAMCATGSYANDLSRIAEDASSYAALTELECLTGLVNAPEMESRLKRIVERGNPELLPLVGQSLFDHIYLLDREKSNQGLAEDSHELAVLASNAIEALVLSGGDLYVQELKMHNVYF
ncbi:MAG: hypothetical protein AAF639_42580 [Chloroflexota bacterium]